MGKLKDDVQYQNMDVLRDLIKENELGDKWGNVNFKCTALYKIKGKLKALNNVNCRISRETNDFILYVEHDLDPLKYPLMFSTSYQIFQRSGNTTISIESKGHPWHGDFETSVTIQA